MRTERLTFPNAQGQELSARLELPVDRHPHNYALFAHCFTCSKNLNAVKNISRGLINEGFAVLRFDFTGLGDSEGDFADTNFSTNVEDLVAACQYLGQHYQNPSLLVGHSLGGAAVLKAAESLKDVRAIGTIGAPYLPEHVLNHMEDDLEQIQQEGQSQVNLGGRPFTIRKQFIEDLQAIQRPNYIRDLGTALLVMHSPQDKTVPVENATKIYKAAGSARSFISIDGADHLLSRGEDALYAGKTIGEWAKRYVELPKEEPLATDKDVAVRTGESFTSQVRVGQHGFTADEPQAVGGNNFGPTPYDLLMASLGSCTGMTIRMYADHKKWPLESVEVHLKHDRIHQTECHCEDMNADKQGKISYITREIELSGELSQEQRQKLLEVANKCPVHRTIEGCVKVDTQLRN